MSYPLAENDPPTEAAEEEVKEVAHLLLQKKAVETKDRQSREPKMKPK